ncbi:MAG: hypothetical protein ACPGJU_03465 [Coraliomargarita sp.]
MQTTYQAQPETRSNGFALVLALSLMAFIVLLLLSITTLVRVETAVSSKALEKLHAEENARLALMIALGELQRYAGPDQRVTARADILDPDSANPFWTGVWDTTQPTAAPRWMVSGYNNNFTPDPAQLVRSGVRLEAASNYPTNASDFENFDATTAHTVPSPTGQFAWWVSDEGLKAAVPAETRLLETLEALAEPESYLDYTPKAKRTLMARHDPNFDFPLFFDINNQSDSTDESLKRLVSSNQVAALLTGKDADEQATILSSFRHNHTLENRFVLSDPDNGGLKKDLSFLKTLDANTVSQSELDTLYAEPDSLITPEVIKLVQFRGNPTASPSDEIIGMQIGEDDIATTEAKANHFDLVPVISELQVSLGVATDGGNVSNSTITDSPLHLVYKIYLELWNPYTIPILIGDTTMDESRGFSDVVIEINNLPSFTIVNNSTTDNAVGALPDIRIRWSDHQSQKILRPGMVFRTSLPLDPSRSGPAHGDNNSGTIQLPLGSVIRGSRSDDYTGSFSMSGSPVQIIIKGINQSAEEREIARTELSNYSNFTINYDYNSYNNRASWLKRVPTSETGAWGMNTRSLEVPGYAFAFRYRMLDEQELPGSINDLSQWFSTYDIRSRTIEADISACSIDDAWTASPPLPYDFKVSFFDTDLGNFDPDESFKGDHFFHYETSSGYTGRRDRIARVIDLPTSEVSNLGSLRALKYRDYPANALANKWGNELNEHYDRYFFSTLPDPDIEQWDGKQPLANSRLIAQRTPPQLTDQNAAQGLQIKNGFNLNSTSINAWKSILSGKSYSADSFKSRYEQDDSGGQPDWFELNEDIDRLFVNHPHGMIHNLNEKATAPRYEFVSRASPGSYLDSFSIDNINWLEQLQYPTFYQSIREMTEADIEELSRAIVENLQAYVVNNGHPPFSMADYLNSGLLEDAIDSVPSLNNRNSNSDLIARYSPAHISQATLMNAVSAYSFVRSDTFKIRSYGTSIDPIDGSKLSETYLEAIVQRTPEDHSESPFGRRFKIVDIRRIYPIQ